MQYRDGSCTKMGDVVKFVQFGADFCAKMGDVGVWKGRLQLNAFAYKSFGLYGFKNLW